MYGVEIMTRLEELNDYLTNTVSVSYGLGIGGNAQVLNIVFDGITAEEEQKIKDDLVVLFPDVVNFS